jgi:hypothetical protein
MDFEAPPLPCTPPTGCEVSSIARELNRLGGKYIVVGDFCNWLYVTFNRSPAY